MTASTSRRCIVCEASSEVLYERAEDLYFDSGFTCRYRLCSNLRCRTVLQDPIPNHEELRGFYRSYYTQRTLTSAQRLEKTVRGKIQALLMRRIERDDRGAPAPDEKIRASHDLLDMAGVLPGSHTSVLDVGCGNGESMVMMKALGYARVQGTECDAKAAASARSLGFEVGIGHAEALPFADASFDVLYLRHVIEHVRDPRLALRECARVLKPHGYLSLVTPNAASTLHRRFGMAWRGLEAPRHLQIFTTPSLKSLVQQGSFSVVRAGKSNRSAKWMEAISSRGERKQRNAKSPAKTLCDFEFGGEIEHGEEIYLIAQRA